MVRIPADHINAQLSGIGRSMADSICLGAFWKDGEYHVRLTWPDGFTAPVSFGPEASTILSKHTSEAPPMSEFETHGQYEVDRSAVAELLVGSLFDALMCDVETGAIKLSDAYRIREQFAKSAELQGLIDQCIKQTLVGLQHVPPFLH